MEHIKRMEVELQELEEKIEKLTVFLEKEKKEPKFTDEEHRTLLKLQKGHMEDYASVLKQRIYYDTLKAHGEIETPCSTSENYDTVAKECFK